MGRRVAVHLRRRVTSLDGLWDFSFLGDADPDGVEVGQITYTDAMAVPGCWDATPAYAGRRGLAAYRTICRVSDATPHQLVFDSAQHWCRVFADGEQLAEHGGGFTRFRVEVPVGPPRRVTIVVLVDNRDNGGRSPLHRDYYDWYHYGGIAGPVELHRLGHAWVNAVRCTTVELVPVPVIELTVTAGAERAGPERWTVSVDGQLLLEELVELAPVSSFVRRLELPGASLWSLGQPALHVLEVELGEDDYRQRIGLRTVTVEGRDLTVNGRPVHLRGVNRHDSHPDHGFAVPDDQRLADLQLISDLRANFVRGSHYPQAEGFLDLCDERGIAVWCESTAWQPDVRQLADEGWLVAAEQNIDEMVAMATNHPSVLIWGCCNEGASKDPQCRPGFERLLARLRALDPSRPVTYATMQPFQAPEVAAELADIVAVNTYPGWYWGGIEDIPAELARIEAAVEAAGLADRPLIVAEIGAEAIPGWRDRSGVRWSEEYQAQLIESVLSSAFSPDRTIAGVALWVFADFRVTDREPLIMRRPRAHNNKGIFDEHRRAKLSAVAAEQAFNEARQQPRP
jgi:beta-glucuronidase